jgi:RNA polymerase sigma factor (sigma-70 family)
MERKREKHGHTSDSGKMNPTYLSWTSMKQRCYNNKHEAYKKYYGRGITVCDRWRNSFINFLKDMGERPIGKTLDRINNNGNYEPSNCKWSTLKEQARNTRRNVFIDGMIQTDFCRKNNISLGSVTNRRNLGWDEKEVIIGHHRPNIGKRSSCEKHFKEFKITIMNKFKKSADVIISYLSLLDAKEREILKRRLGLINGKRETLDDIAKDYGLTRERIRQIEYKALKKIAQFEEDISVE